MKGTYIVLRDLNEGPSPQSSRAVAGPATRGVPADMLRPTPPPPEPKIETWVLDHKEVSELARATNSKAIAHVMPVLGIQPSEAATDVQAAGADDDAGVAWGVR